MPDIWMDVDQNLAEVPVNLLPLLDDTDFKSREEAVAYNAAGLELIWHFVTTAGATSATVVTPTTGGDYDWAHQGGGLYTIGIPASGGASINNDTEGFGWFTGVATGVLPWRGPIIGFRAAGLNNALIDSAYSTTRGLAGTALPDAAADAPGGLAAETTAQSIKAKTDQLTFTTPNKVDASAEVTVDAGAIAEAVAAEVWEHTPRTLTSPATGADDSTTATAITRRRGDDWSIAVSSLELAGYQEVWFTIKRGYEALDTAAMLQVKQTTGLVRLNGAAPAAGEAVKASLAVNGTNDTATITVRAEATAQLLTGTFVYDLQWMDSAGDIHTVSLGTFTVSSDVTRATS